jgi:cell division protein FtsL
VQHHLIDKTGKTMDISMDNVSQIVQKVRQAHWRVQRQWIGLFLLALVAVSMVAAIYLNITVRATVAGREVQLLQPTLINDQRKNSDLETELARLTSVESMQKRAEIAGYRPAKPEDFTYVPVSGYTPSTAVNMSQPTPASQVQSRKPAILPEYTESLFDWITRTLAESAGGQP